MKALFVGLGSIGQRHLRNLLRLVPDVEVSAVRRTRSVPLLSDTNQIVHGKSVTECYGLIEYESLDMALEHAPDLVFVTNPSNLHCETAARALDGSAYIFLEKPLSIDLASSYALLAKEQAKGQKKIAVGYQFRFHPALLLVKSLLQDHRIGRIVGARMVNGEYMPGWHPYEDYRKSYAARRELGGGALMTQCHDFDCAIWLFGEPQHIFAVGGQLSSLEVDVEDSVQILMSCQHDGMPVPVSVSLDYLQWPAQRGFSIVGEEGCIDCDLIKAEVILSNRSTEKIERYEFPDFIRNEMFVNQMRNFLNFAANKGDPAVGLQAGILSVRAAISAQQSLEKQCAIDLRGG